jgi:hypothetical protein
MRPVTIKLNHVTREDNSVFDGHTPQDPGLMLECNEKTLLAMNIVRDMANGIETLMVPDGVVCTITIRNDTGPWTGVFTATIIFFNYTVYHGDEQNTKTNPIVMFRGDSSETEANSFQCIRECFFTKLYRHINITTIYTGTDPRNKVIEWLVVDLYDCKRKVFLHRYALTTINFAAPKNGICCHSDGPRN